MGRPRKETETKPETAKLEEGTTEIGEPVEGGEVIQPDTEVSELEALRLEAAEMRRELAELKRMKSGGAAEEVVELTYIASVSPHNVLSLGEYGSLNGVGGYIEIPRKEFGGKFLTPVVRSLLKDRKLIVCSGLNREERRRYGVDYSEGEVMDLAAFDRLLDLDLEGLTTLFQKLCLEHKEFVASRFISAYEKGDNRISREKVEPLNDLSKAVEPKGMFRPILEGMNKI